MSQRDSSIVKTDGAPQAIGPYSQAVISNGVVYCSGQVALDPKTMQMVGSTTAEQTVQVLKNLTAVLAAAGCLTTDVVRCTVFLKNLGDFAAMNEIYGKTFSENPPSRSTVEAARLPKDALVEIDCIAVIGHGKVLKSR